MKKSNISIGQSLLLNIDNETLVLFSYLKRAQEFDLIPGCGYPQSLCEEILRAYISEIGIGRLSRSLKRPEPVNVGDVICYHLKRHAVRCRLEEHYAEQFKRLERATLDQLIEAGIKQEQNLLASLLSKHRFHVQKSLDWFKELSLCDVSLDDYSDEDLWFIKQIETVISFLEDCPVVMDFKEKLFNIFTNNAYAVWHIEIYGNGLYKLTYGGDYRINDWMMQHGKE